MSHVKGCLISTGAKTGLTASLVAARTNLAITCRIRIRCYPTSTKNDYGEALGFLSTEQIGTISIQLFRGGWVEKIGVNYKLQLPNSIYLFNTWVAH